MLWVARHAHPFGINRDFFNDHKLDFVAPYMFIQLILLVFISVDTYDFPLYAHTFLLIIRWLHLFLWLGIYIELVLHTVLPDGTYGKSWESAELSFLKILRFSPTKWVLFCRKIQNKCDNVHYIISCVLCHIHLVKIFIFKVDILKIWKM